MKTYLTNVLGNSLVAAGLLLGSTLLQAQDKPPLMPTNEVDPDPFRKFDPNKDVLVYAIDSDGTKIPEKTVKIFNYGQRTIYPMLRSANSKASSTDPSVGAYDPYDPLNQEFRGYIGFRDQEKLRFGLKPSQSIEFRVPLVFWDAFRIFLITEPEYITPEEGKPNPYEFNPKAKYVAIDAISKDGVVLWYHSPEAKAPANEAPDQLAEWTIRDPYLGNPAFKRKGGDVPDDQKLVLIDYDVSFVDTMFMPVSMQALDVPVGFKDENDNKGLDPRPYGWTGSIAKSEQLQDLLKRFTASNEFLGDYFKEPNGDSHGWPAFYLPEEIKSIKIPSGAKLIEQSPLSGSRSKFDGARMVLNTSGTAPVKVANIGGAGDADSGFILTLAPSKENLELVKKLRPGLRVAGNPPAKADNPIKPGTKIKEILSIGTDTIPAKIKLDTELQASQRGATFDFIRPISDYASTALTKLWYSWVKYYLDHTQTTADVPNIQGTMEKFSNTIAFDDKVQGLIPGMLVTADGLPKPDPSKKKGGVVILSVAGDKKSVELSQLAPNKLKGRFDFKKPQPLPMTPPDLFTINFNNDIKFKKGKDPSRDPFKFAEAVYLVMASMAQVPYDPTSEQPPVLQLMVNVIGGNVGKLHTPEEAKSKDADQLDADIRDMLKSLLRGVTDFTVFPERYPNNFREFQWYPNPKEPRGGLTFNAFNLDPYVWFVHVKVGYSGYGFSLDDDKANVGARGATKLLLTYGGPPVPPANKEEFTPATPFGPLTFQADWDPKKTQVKFFGIEDASNTSPIVIRAATDFLKENDQITISGVKGNTAANGIWKVTHLRAKSFALTALDGTTSKGNGAYVSGTGVWKGPKPFYFLENVSFLDVYERLRGDDPAGTFDGPNVIYPNQERVGSVRVKMLGEVRGTEPRQKRGDLLLTGPLRDKKGNILPKKVKGTWTLKGY